MLENFDFLPPGVSFAFKFYCLCSLACRTCKEHIAVGHILKYDGAIDFLDEYRFFILFLNIVVKNIITHYRLQKYEDFRSLPNVLVIIFINYFIMTVPPMLNVKSSMRTSPPGFLEFIITTQYVPSASIVKVCVTFTHSLLVMSFV